MIVRLLLVLVLIGCSTPREELRQDPSVKTSSTELFTELPLEPELTILPPPLGRAISLGYGFTLYRDGYREVLVTPYGGQITGAPNGPGLICTRTLGMDCRVKKMALVANTLYLITNQQVYRFTPDDKLYSIELVKNNKFDSVTFDVFTDPNNDAAIAWNTSTKKFAGILAHRSGGWDVLTVTSKYPAKLKKLTPGDVIGLRQLGANEYGIVLSNKIMLTVSTKPVQIMVGAR